MTQETHSIGTAARLPLTALNTFHKNPRRGDVEAIKTSMLTNGIYKPIVVNKGTFTKRTNEVLAGNHSLMAIRQIAEENPDDPQWQTVDVWLVDVDEDRAARIVLADNRTADLGDYDNAELFDLLTGMDDDLDGTGYTAEDVEILKDLEAGPQSLDDLEDEFGEPEDDDFWITVRLRIPPVVNEQWVNWLRDYDSPEEAFEALLDRGVRV